MGFFKKKRSGGKIGAHSKGGGMAGTEMKMSGYSIFKGSDESKSKPITKKAGNNL